MSDTDFQREVLQRLAQIEAKIAAQQSQIGERCERRKQDIDLIWSKYSEMKKRIEPLEHAEQRRKGGIVVIGALLTAAGALGALLSRWLETPR